MSVPSGSGNIMLQVEQVLAKAKVMRLHSHRQHYEAASLPSTVEETNLHEDSALEDVALPEV